ncbi:TPA: flagellar export chaperone FlgN [Candidatus Spyradomonas excrementavium]|nr:flagellar export chaperone FlgN [Candidatus Spyradomonas excrementavium]
MEILELENLIDSEIEQYKTIEKLYVEKKEILLHAKSDELLKIDAKILDVVQNISNISAKRKEVSEKLGIMTPSLSEIIGLLRTKDPESVPRFEQKQKTVRELSKKISELERANLELTKHGLQFTNKTLEAILKGASLNNQEYNEQGKSVQAELPEMSSIVEDV